MRSDQIDVRNLPDDPEAFRMSLVEHLVELRKRIIVCVIAIGVAMTVGWFLFPVIYELIVKQVKLGLPPKMLKEFREVFFSPMEGFNLRMRLSFILGIILSIPILLHQLWGFVAPGLKEKERKPFRVILPFSVGLFFLGAFFGWLIIPATIQWFMQIMTEGFADAIYTPRPEPLVMLVSGLLFGFGASFQLPMVVYFLVKVELLSVDTLMKNWRQAVVVIFVLAATFTPSADPFSMLMMAIPLCILFALSVFAANLSMKKSTKSEEDLDDDETEDLPTYTGKAVPFKSYDEEIATVETENDKDRVE